MSTKRNSAIRATRRVSHLRSVAPARRSVTTCLQKRCVSTILFEKRIQLKLSGNEDHYTACSSPVIFKNSCSKLHC